MASLTSPRPLLLGNLVDLDAQSNQARAICDWRLQVILRHRQSLAGLFLALDPSSDSFGPL
jgi:hypothetical protein